MINFSKQTGPIPFKFKHSNIGLIAIIMVEIFKFKKAYTDFWDTRYISRNTRSQCKLMSKTNIMQHVKIAGVLQANLEFNVANSSYGHYNFLSEGFQLKV